MRIPKLHEWLDRSGRRKRAATYRLVHETLELRAVVATWDADELAQEDDAGASLLATAAQDHCDELEQSAAYRFEAVDAADNVIASLPARCKPVLTDETRPTALLAHAASGYPELLVHFMQSDTAKLKILLTTLGTIMGASDKVLTQQTKMIDAQARIIQDLNTQLQAVRSSRDDGEREASEEERMEAAAKATAWNRVCELLPEFASTMMHVARARHGGANGLDG